MSTTLRETPLHAAHLRLGAKMVDFGGWHMPVQYPEGILAEHRAVRQHVGVFDVSHMGEIDFNGPTALATVNALVTNDVEKLAVGRAMYTVVCHPHGGIVDDCIVYRLGETWVRIVVNASNIAKDEAFFRTHAGGRCDIANVSDELALIAVQGPQAIASVCKLAGNQFADVPSFAVARGELAGTAILAARTGYTGEDGFELFVPANAAESVWNALLDAGAVPVGLGARDTLRLEARLCLYGNDIDDTTDPFEAGLAWVVKLDKACDFVGKAALVERKTKGPKRRLVGFRVLDRGVARAGAEIVDDHGQRVGTVTSGNSAPTIGGAVGMGYVPLEMSKPSTTLTLVQRGKQLAAQVVQGPFYRRPA